MSDDTPSPTVVTVMNFEPLMGKPHLCLAINGMPLHDARDVALRLEPSLGPTPPAGEPERR